MSPPIVASPVATPLLHARGVTADYGAGPVLDDVDLLVPEGRLTVLVGPNGSGKSTLLATLARLMRPRRGAVLLDGRDIFGLPTRAVARRVGLLPQSPLVPEGLSVHDLVARGRYPHQSLLRQWSAADEAAVTRALTVTGTLDLADRPVDGLSGGQRQRCFIALALAQETGILLFDEPTSFLDLRYQIDVMELIAALPRDHGRTAVAVLHDVNFALNYADRLVFLKHGRIHAVVEPAVSCSAALVAEVFETPVVATTHPQTGVPVFLPAAGR